jgi:hypothetical protein
MGNTEHKTGVANDNIKSLFRKNKHNKWTANLKGKFQEECMGKFKYVHESCRTRYHKELMQLFGYLDILSFVRIGRRSWIGYVNRMDS